MTWNFTRKALAIFALTSLCSTSMAEPPYLAGTDGYPERIRRADAFLGVHFDYHARSNTTRIGENVTPQMVHDIIDRVKPDYIQVDCKGHPGYASYPTQMRNQAAGFVKDQLRIWREVTAERGVSLYMHYSGVYDEKAVADHPQWAAVKADGSPHKTRTSTFGHYVDKLMLPQLLELRNEYGVDGYWVDGDCWAAVRDYNPKVLERFVAETGIAEIPKSPDEPHWYEWSQFNREAFRNYLRHYVDTLHEAAPGVEVMSNFAFSSMMPEPVTADLDHLSGDCPMQNGVRSPRWESRCFRNQGKPWELLAWGFCSGSLDMWWFSAKPAEQLKQEAAQAVATGGGFQCYYRQRSDCSIRPWQMDVMAEVATFCRERQAYCHRAESVPQIALFYSTEDIYRKATKLFNPGEDGQWTAINGVLNALLDGQHHVDVVMEHQLEGHCADYPVIVFPEWEYLKPDLHTELIDYVERGGNLLVIGPKSVQLFKEELGVDALDHIKVQARWLHHDNFGSGIEALMCRATLRPDVQSMGLLVEDDYPSAGGWPAASLRTLGRGKIAGLFTDIGAGYYGGRTTVVRDFLAALLDELHPNPLVEVAGSHNVDLIVNRKEIEGKERLAINLVNTFGPHQDMHVNTYDSIPPLGPLTLSIQIDNEPARIVCQPGNKPMPFTYRDGKAIVEIARLEIHNVYVVYEHH